MHAFVYHLQLYEAQDESQVNVLLKNKVFSFAYDCGFNSPITFAHKSASTSKFVDKVVLAVAGCCGFRQV